MKGKVYAVSVRWPVRAVFTSQLRTSKLRHFKIVSLHNCDLPNCVTSQLRHFHIVFHISKMRQHHEKQRANELNCAHALLANDTVVKLQ